MVTGYAQKDTSFVEVLRMHEQLDRKMREFEITAKNEILKDDDWFASQMEKMYPYEKNTTP